SNLTTGSNNIEIANNGVAGESKVIRIGTQGTQTATLIAGISGQMVASGTPVMVNSLGRLGVAPSSARYKHAIRDMGEGSSRLMKLRPVSFHYNNDSTGTLQYGLIAEEVDQLYPELVTHDADGKVDAVRYLTLTSMLLNEVQKQSRENAEQAEQLRRMAAELAAARQENTSLRASSDERLARVERAVAPRDDGKMAAAWNQ